MDTIISQEEVAALLGRSLSKIEKDNFSMYLKIAQERLEDLLCSTFSKPLPPGLALLLARCFATITEEQTLTVQRGVKSKKVEDFSIAFDENPDAPMNVFVKQNSGSLEKYSKCQAEIRHGKVV